VVIVEVVVVVVVVEVLWLLLVLYHNLPRLRFASHVFELTFALSLSDQLICIIL